MPQNKDAVKLTPAQRDRIRAIREKLAHRPPISEILTPEEKADAVAAGDYQVLREWMADFRAKRIEAGKTLAEIATETGIAAETLSRLESGNATNPTFKTLSLLARAVGKRIAMSID